MSSVTSTVCTTSQLNDTRIKASLIMSRRRPIFHQFILLKTIGWFSPRHSNRFTARCTEQRCLRLLSDNDLEFIALQIRANGIKRQTPCSLSVLSIVPTTYLRCLDMRSKRDPNLITHRQHLLTIPLHHSTIKHDSRSREVTQTLPNRSLAKGVCLSLYQGILVGHSVFGF